jgi:hypothetical protein
MRKGEPDPRPRAPVRQLAHAELAPVRRTSLLTALRPPPLDFHQLFISRRSQRSLRRARLKDELGWLSYATAPQFVAVHEGLPRSRRPALASGALHAVTPILFSGGGRPRAWRCRPEAAVVDLLAITDGEAIRRLRAEAAELLPGCPGCDLIVVVVDDELLAAAYEDPDSLAWRDAGTLFQTLALAATALGLGFCPLGILGNAALDGLAAQDRFRALGMAVVGA